MASESISQSQSFSQIETRSDALRVILLGASNLSMSFANVIATTRAHFAQPIEFHVAMGFGRSFCQESKFFGKKFSGILESDLWSALECAPRVQTVAIVADVGNDLAYGAPPEVVLEGVGETLDRLRALDAKVALNNVPLASLQSVGALRYRIVKTLLFPRFGLSRAVMRERTETLSADLDQLAREREIPVFSGEFAWYGFDPIHPRRRSRGAIWQRMLAALAAEDSVPKWLAPSRGDARALRALNARFWMRESTGDDVLAPSARLSDGSFIALY